MWRSNDHHSLTCFNMTPIFSGQFSAAYLTALITFTFPFCPVLSNLTDWLVTDLRRSVSVDSGMHCAVVVKDSLGDSFAVTVCILFTKSTTAGRSHRCKQATCLGKSPSWPFQPFGLPLLFVSLLTFLYSAFLPCLSLCQHWEPRPHYDSVIYTETLPLWISRCLVFTKKWSLSWVKVLGVIPF